MKRDEVEFGLRVPPHSVEAEQSVLGSLLMDNACRDALRLSGEDFYSVQHRLIFSVIDGLIGRSLPADIVTVFERLQADGKVDEAGGLAYLSALANCVAGSSNAAKYADIVSDKARRRRLIAALDGAVSKAFGSDETDALLASVGDELAALQRSGQRQEPATFEALALRAIDRYSALADGSGSPGLTTGFQSLDRLLGGLKPGRLYGIAARPSVGKSTVARAIAVHCAMAGHRTLLASQEMPQDEVVDCVIAQLGRVDSELLQSGRLQAEHWERLVNVLSDNKHIPLLIDEQGGLTIHDIRSKARGVRGLKLMVIDYLQLCVSTLKGKTTNDEVAEISKGLKQLALALQIPVIVLSQLSRKVEERADREPVLSDLRDSGAIEQDLDVALMLWTALHEDGQDWRTVGFKVCKNRGGRLGRFAMHFDAPVYRWAESDFPAKGLPATKRGGGL